MIWITRMVDHDVPVDGRGVDGYYRKILVEAIEAWLRFNWPD